MKAHSIHVQRTKSYFKTAFIELVHQKGYSAVTVKDIVNYAQYNRTTFYLYYQNIAELVEELMAEKYEEIQLHAMPNYAAPFTINVQKLHSNSFDLFYYIYDHRNYFTLVLLKDTLPYIHQQLPLAIFNLLSTKLDILYTTAEVDEAIQKRYMAYGTSGLILDWITKGFDVSPSEMTDRLIGILKTMAKGFTIKEIEHPISNES